MLSVRVAMPFLPRLFAAGAAALRSLLGRGHKLLTTIGKDERLATVTADQYLVFSETRLLHSFVPNHRLVRIPSSTLGAPLKRNG